MTNLAHRTADEEPIDLDDEMTIDGARELRAALARSEAQIARGEFSEFDDVLAELQACEGR